MNDSMLTIFIYAATFIGIGGAAYLFCPRDMEEFKSIINKQKGKKSGLLLLISPALVPLGVIIKNLPFGFMKKYLLKLEKWLVSADLETVLKPEEFVALELLVPLFLVPFLVLAIFNIPSFAMLKQPFPAAGAFTLVFFFGMLFPVISLKDKIKRRQKSISRELPFALDMLTSAVQAGLDFSGAIRRFLQKSSKPTPFKNEMSLMLKEISLGKTRAEALRRMAERVDLRELTMVVNALIQADQLGTSLATVLTNLSDDLRVRRFQLAEKMALEAPVKMLFPLIAFIFPAVFIILIGPLIIQMVSELGKK